MTAKTEQKQSRFSTETPFKMVENGASKMDVKSDHFWAEKCVISESKNEQFLGLKN